MNQLEKYLDFAKELKKLWNMKEMVIPIIVGALGIIWQYLEKKLLGLARIRRRVLRNWGVLLSLHQKPPVSTGVNNPERDNNNLPKNCF